MAKIRLRRLKPPVPCADRADYEERLEKLQLRLLSLQQAYFHEKRRAVIVFEGWDAAGKGGAIRRLVERLDPRSYTVWPIGAPTPEEQGHHYLRRFWARLPEPGAAAIFDRSWYGRVLVERVEGLARKTEWKRAYNEINEFERMLVDDGIRLVKIFLHITPEEQLRRFAERMTNPHKRWKLTADDVRNHLRWDDYVLAIDDMFEHTSTDAAPWVAIAADKKWIARLTALECVVRVLAKGVDPTPPSIDPRVRRFAETHLHRLMRAHEKRGGSPKRKSRN